jgi:electron transport complex protein RnfG
MSDARNDFVIPIAVLTAICLVISAALAFTEQATTPVIEATERANAEAARMEVLPGADSFRELSLSDLPAGVTGVFEAENGAGLVVMAQGRGYGGLMRAIIGIDSGGIVTKTKVLSHAETAGLGSKAAEAPFQNQFAGKDSSLAGVDTIAGATVSSGTFVSIVKDAFSAWAAAMGHEQENPVGLDAQKLAVYYPEGTEFEVVESGGVRGIRCGDAGWVVYAVEKGYGGDLTVAVLFDVADSILGVVVDSHAETPGLGSEIAEEEFTRQFVGKTSFESIDNISGATTSCEAMKKAVAAAVAGLPAVKGA